MNKALTSSLRNLSQRFRIWSINKAIREQNLSDLTSRLRKIAPDISRQELTALEGFNEFWELKKRGVHAFQCEMMLSAINTITSKDSLGLERSSNTMDEFNKKKLTVVDIGDSAGTHMLYLKEILMDKFDIDTISVNLDPEAIKKIVNRGMRAIHCRAEDLDLGEQNIDIFTSFEMIEHLHNPSIFFYRLAKRSACNTLVATMPYIKHSRVGLHNVRKKTIKNVIAEEEHIFELNPQDWTLLMLHSGWKVVECNTYFQYPRNIPLLKSIFAYFWRNWDYEGFIGFVLQKDLTYANCYQDWED